MNVSAPFIHRPVATILLSMALLIAGTVAFFFLPVSPLPRVDFPTINISGGLPGASPETMASSIATPLERRFGRIAGVTEITSSSSLGSTSISLQFDLDRNIDAAARDVQAAINAAGGELPPEMPFRPTYRKVNPSDTPILILSLKSKVLPLSKVYDQANTIFAQRILQVPGVGDVFVGGAQQPAVRVQVDPVALAGVGLTLEDVRNTLLSSTSNVPKGSFQGPERMETIGANDQLFGAASFSPLIVSYKNNAPIRLGDISKVFDDVENARAAAWSGTERTVVVVIRRQPDANILATIDRVKELLPLLRTSIAPGIDVSIITDRATTIRASVAEVERTLVISIALVVVVVFVFLRSWRATFIPSVAVPLSIVATFAVMYLMKYSIDNLSLMALTISTGFVVDDAIVVTENIARFIEAGEPPLAAALKGARQISFTIISITISLVAVFVPILMMGGVVGRLFREFAMTLTIAIVLSAVLSITLTPMLCRQLLREEPREQHGPLYRASEWVFDGMLSVYMRGLRWVLRHQRLMLTVSLATVGVTGYLFYLVPKGLFPQQDNGLIIGMSEASQDVSFQTMKKHQEKLNALLVGDPDIIGFVSFVSGANTGNAFISLNPSPPRVHTADEIIARLRPKLSTIPGINLYMQAAQDIRIGARATRTQYQYALADASLDELRTWAPKMLATLSKLPELRDVATDQQLAALQLDITYDRDTAERLGISANAIDQILYDAYGQRQVAISYAASNQYRVILEVSPEYLQEPESIPSLYLRSSSGGLVPL